MSWSSHWTVLEDERELVAGKRGATRLGFALLLKFFTRHGRFPRGGVDLPGEVVAFVAKQVQVEPSNLATYEWTGRTIEYHRSKIRRHLGFRSAAWPMPTSWCRGWPSMSPTRSAGRKGFATSCWPIAERNESSRQPQDGSTASSAPGCTWARRES